MFDRALGLSPAAIAKPIMAMLCHTSFSESLSSMPNISLNSFSYALTESLELRATSWPVAAESTASDMSPFFCPVGTSCVAISSNAAILLSAFIRLSTASSAAAAAAAALSA